MFKKGYHLFGSLIFLFYICTEQLKINKMVKVILNYEVGSLFNEQIMGGISTTRISGIQVSIYGDLKPSDHRIFYNDSVGNHASSDSSYLDVIEKKTEYSFEPLFEIGEYGYVYNNYMGGAKLCKEEVRGYRLNFSKDKVEIEYLTQSAKDKTGIFKSPEDFLKFVTRK